VETNDRAVKVLGDATLRIIAQELVQTVRQNATIDWTVKETMRAKLRVMVRRILRNMAIRLTSRRKPRRLRAGIGSRSLHSCSLTWGCKMQNRL
jgi:hypothetical protein